jgi:formate hydrogenlyase subunit 6/NADH:ubiquinone oxidoreductase subunit I
LLFYQLPKYGTILHVIALPVLYLWEALMIEAYTTFAARYGYTKSERFLKILKILMDDSEVKVANTLPGNAQEVSDKLAMPLDKVEAILAGLFRKGVIFEGGKGYKAARDVFQLHDSTGSDPRSDEIWGRGLLDAWWDFSEEELFKDIPNFIGSLPKPISRVIPARAAVADAARLLPSEDVDVLIEKAARYAVVKCPCRRMAQKCDGPIDVCIQLNRGADYAIKRGSGRELTRQETKEIMQLAAEGGLVHSVLNAGDAGHFICNCCSDCCIFNYPFIKYGVLDKGLAKSRYEARVDAESCSGCQDCVERCPFSAIEMVKVPGQKKMKAKIDVEKCYGCGVCAVNCTTDSIKLFEVRPPEHIPA